MFWRVLQAGMYVFYHLRDTHLCLSFQAQPRAIGLQIKSEFQILNSELRGILL
jgi:hypothetical protein